MSERTVGQNPYTAPAAAVADGSPARQSSLFVRVLPWALLAPFLLLAALAWSPPSLGAFAILLVAFLVIPPLRLLRKKLRQGGFKAVSTGHFLAVAAAAFGAACLGTFFYWVVAVIGFSVWGFLGNGT